MRRIALVAWPMAASLVFACEGVPRLTFEEGDAAADAQDGGPSAGDAADGADANDGGCPGSDPPPAPFVCCGAVACLGLCTGQCDACASKCTLPGQVCCAKTNNVVCIAAGSICH
jgi:hypothetical protein